MPHTCTYVHVHLLHALLDPTEVSLMVDGTTDQCSRGEDIDFELVGFSVFGQVCRSEPAVVCTCVYIKPCSQAFSFDLLK